MTLLWWRVLEIRIYERISSVSDDDVISDAELWCFLCVVPDNLYSTAVSNDR